MQPEGGGLRGGATLAAHAVDPFALMLWRCSPSPAGDAVACSLGAEIK